MDGLNRLRKNFVLYQGTTLVAPQMIENTWALQAAEKICFVSGHDFSRAANEPAAHPR
jgi:hypothetical protein